MKLAVLGGGGVRSPFLSKSIALGAKEIGITETVLWITTRKNFLLSEK